MKTLGFLGAGRLAQMLAPKAAKAGWKVILANSRGPDSLAGLVQGMEGDVIIIQDIFVYDKEKGLIRQPFIPSFIKSLNAVGYQWPGTK